MWKLRLLCVALVAGMTMVPAFAETVGSSDSDEKDEKSDSVPVESNEDTAAQEDFVANTSLIYSINRTPEPLFETARAAQVITIDDIWRRNARTLPEVLMEEAGIFVQQNNFGGGSPIIRGFMGKQILIMVDGVRVNNSTYRLGPMQYLSGIDINMVDRIEVVRGVGSVLGNDALGGTINIITKKGPPRGRRDKVGASVFSRLSSSDDGFTGRGEVFGATDKLRYSGGITYRSSGDVGAGGLLQSPAGYDEQGGNAALDFFASDEKTISFQYQDLQQNQVPSTDKISSGQYLVYDYELLRLQLARVAYQDLTNRGWSNFFQVTGFWNRQQEKSRQIATPTPFLELAPIDRQNVFGINLEMGTFLGQSHRLLYGVEYSTESINSITDVVRGTDYVFRITQGAYTTKMRGRYTDGATYDTLAAYLQDRFDLGNRLTMTLGARYGRYSVGGSESTPIGPINLESGDGALTGAANVVFHLTPQMNLVGGVTRGFRSPNIDDIATVELSSTTVQVPAPQLTPEKILSFEIGTKYSNQRLSGSAFFFHSRLTDLIELPLEGADVDIGFPIPFKLLQRQNIGEATMRGIELEGQYHPLPTLNIFGNFTWTEGQDDLKQIPLPRIPPKFGLLGFRWSSRSERKLWTELVYRFAGAQRRLNPQDAADPHTGPTGTDGFHVLHFRSGLSLWDRARLNFAVENIFDEIYMHHSSGVYRPGRQVVLGIEFRF